MIVVGEASGDMHGAKLIQELKNNIPNIDCYGLGGKHLKESGVKIHVDASELSVVGLVEIIKHYPRLFKILNKMRSLIKSSKPDLLILIDSPDFNLPLAKTAKKYGITVMYYISPQIWAWRSSRIKTIKKCVDMMAVIFPFEEKFYRNAGVPVQYVGNPLVKDAVSSVDKASFIQTVGLDSTKKIIGLFPGSRVSEIERNYPTLIDAAEILGRQRDDIQFITPIASTLSKEFIHKIISHTNIKIITTSSNIYDVIEVCDVIAAASGTVTLQIALMQTPMLIMYKISEITYKLLRKFIKSKYVGIANVIADKEICKELIQNDATANKISKELNCLLSDATYVHKMKAEMKKVREILGEKNGSFVAAKIATELIAK